jgi:hypothetical protein
MDMNDTSSPDDFEASDLAENRADAGLPDAAEAPTARREARARVLNPMPRPPRSRRDVMGGRIASGILAIAFAAVPVAARCAFVCKPPGASTIIRDYPPPECAGVDIRELYPDGSQKGIIPAQLTEAQKRARAEKEKRQAECRRQNQAWAQEGEALLARYPSEDDLLRDRDVAVAHEKARVEQQNQRLKDLKRVRAHLEDETEFYKGRQMPDVLTNSLEANDIGTAAAEREIEAINSALERITKKFDVDLARYRSIVTGTAKPPVQCEE